MFFYIVVICVVLVIYYKMTKGRSGKVVNSDEAPSAENPRTIIVQGTERHMVRRQYFRGVI